jgi:hypothetical protein
MHITKKRLIWPPVLLMLSVTLACGVLGRETPTPTPDAVPPGPPPPISAPLGSDFQLAYGQTANLNDEGLSVTFAEVEEDTRCPLDIECVHGGWVTIRLAVEADEEDGEDVALTLQPGAADPVMASVGGYTIALVEVEPYPVSTEPIGFNEYVATVRVSR